jgi:hypothetical protein
MIFILLNHRFKVVTIIYKKSLCVLWIVVYPFVLFLLVIVLPVLLRFTDSDYPFGIFWSLCCLFLTNNDLQNTMQKTKDLATPLIPGMNTGAPDEYVALAPLVAPLVNNMMTTHDVYVKDKYTVVTLKKSCYCDNCFD